jgi:hypothetical protein
LKLPDYPPDHPFHTMLTDDQRVRVALLLRAVADGKFGFMKGRKRSTGEEVVVLVAVEPEGTKEVVDKLERECGHVALPVAPITILVGEHEIDDLAPTPDVDHTVMRGGKVSPKSVPHPRFMGPSKN